MNSSKSLDLPTQQELLAQHRCDETILELCVILQAKFAEIMEFVQNDQLEAFIGKLKNVVDTVVTDYFEKLHRYPAQIVQFKHENLLRRIKELVEPLFSAFCTKIEKKALKLFELEFQKSSNLTVIESVERGITFYRTSIQGIIVH